MLTYILQILFLGYLGLTGFLLQKVLSVFFKFERNWRTFILAAFLSLTIYGSFSGAAVILYRFDYLTMAVISLISIAIFYLLSLWADHLELPRLLPDSPEQGKNENLKENEPKITPVHILLILIYAALAVFGFFLLFTSKTGEAVTTPWQTIDKNYIYVFAGATAVLCGLLFLNLRKTVLLILFSVHSLLLTSYLPLTHELVYGGDAWRHIATEERVISGGDVFQPAISDQNASTNVGFLVGKLAYSQSWGISILLSKFGFDLLDINKWFMPIIWSLIFPLLVYEIGRSLRLGNRFSLLYVLLGFLPFSFQATGSFTLPSNFGFLVWLLFVLLIFKRAQNPEPEQKYILLLAGLSLIFGYSLYTLLFWLGWFVFEIIRIKSDFSYTEITVTVLLIAVVLPLCEWFFGYSSILPSGSIVEGFKQFLGNFTGYYLATGPRPHDILTGNVIFNQAPNYAYVKNIFIQNGWLLLAFMAIFWSVVVYGLWVAFHKGFGSLPVLSGNFNDRTERNNLCWFLSISIGLCVGYIVSRYWLPGEHLLTRRLDAVLAFLFLTLFVLGASQIPKKYRSTPALFLGLTFLVFGISASYSLGPDTSATSVDELAAMRYIWQKEKDREKHCVIADVFPLLSLEAISNKSIIGGGFPISSNFAQIELSGILNRSDSDISILDVRKGLQITGADKCYIIVPSDHNVSYYIKQAASSTNFGSINVWEYGKRR